LPADEHRDSRTDSNDGDRESVVARAPIHGELLKLGIAVSERTGSRILRTVKRPPSQTWKTLLKNHVGEIVSVDFFTVPSATLRVLYVFLVLEHKRRKGLHFGGTNRRPNCFRCLHHFRLLQSFVDSSAPKEALLPRFGHRKP
jgi:hypothetical protein